MRAAMSACSVSGTRFGVAALDEHADRLLDEQRVALCAVEQPLRQRRGIHEVGDDRGHELLALGLRKRLELDCGRAHAPSSPRGPHVEQVGARQAEDEQRRAYPVGEVLDEVEHRLFGPVDVLEEKDERLHVAQRVHHLAGGPRDLLRAALAFDRLEQSSGEPDEVGDGVVLAALAKLLERLLERLVVGDPHRRLDHLGERPVRHALAVRQAAALEHTGAVDRVDELTGQPALADARLAVDREDVCAAVAQRSLVRVLEELELGFAADERRIDVDVPLVDRAEHPPGAHRGAHALELERACILDEEPSASEAVRGRADEDLARHGRLLQACREVHGLARGERRVRLVDDDLACLDADADLEVQLADGVAHTERSPRRPLGVILVRLRNAERGEHRVSRELLDDAAVHGDAMGYTIEELGHPPPHDLGVSPGDELRRVDDVDEENCCKLSLYGSAHHVSVRTTSRGLCFRHSITRMLNPAVFKAYDVRGIYPDELDEDGAYAVGRAYVEHFEPRRIAVGKGHAAVGAGNGARSDRRCGRRGRRRLRYRHGRHRDALLRRRRARARGRHRRHRLAQPEGVHRDEDRAPRGAAGRRRFRPVRHPRPGPFGHV